MKLTKLIKKAKLSLSLPETRDFTVRGITCNSGQVKKGFVFIAIKGCSNDGTRFIHQALKNGAGAVISPLTVPPEINTRLIAAKLAAEFYANPSAKIRVVGITGTNGKTTVSYLLERVLKEALKNPAVIGTINYRFNKRIIPSNNTTPGPVDLQHMLSRMLKGKVTHCVMEVSSHALDQERVKGIGFSSAIFTNLTSDHLDYHKTLSGYFKAKAKLFKELDRKAFAVINNDDKYARFLKKICAAKVITYGINKSSSVMARNIKFNPSSTEFILKIPRKELLIKTKLIGRHNVYNVLSVIAWALNEGIKFSHIKRAIEGFDFVPGRLERVECKKGFSVFVDYAHTEDALRNIIRSLRQVSKGRIIVVFGCGGDRDKIKRPKMGKTVTELADYALITSDNPRSEDPAEIARDIIKGIRKKNYAVILQRRDAIKKSLVLAKNGDIVLIAGKGHETYQVIKDKKIHFDDRKVVKSCLK
ncbi:MAG: UDP-N-acetylmuramoyl-L-alanyl-D-glutamate--2,6-diaminopimelate ligase [Candidatus Omnitrophota bacterium]|jgi:UDP-N-acetylmuramoyl-L-alanyl-D-glutamate--2,6-diaminopimelate ligase